MKIALCFLISYEHKVNKEKIWVDWITKNSDIINIYFHYKDKTKIKSEWILKHCIPENYVMNTSYYFVVGAYLSTVKYALLDDVANKWFIFLTESCVPIISPERFRRFFNKYCNFSIIRWRPAWWNVSLHKRANLHYLPKNLRLGHDPWFVIERNDILACISYIEQNGPIYNLIFSGGLANESLFVILLKSCGRLENVINEPTTASDWSRMASTTSPYIFKIGNVADIDFIINFLHQNKFTMFLRKVDEKFPDDVILEFMNNDKEKIDNEYCVDRSIIVSILFLFFVCYLVYLEIF